MSDTALETVRKFCIPAGSKVIISKTECFVLRPFKNLFIEIEGIRVSNKSVKCIGIHVGHDKIECYNKALNHEFLKYTVS